MLCVCAFQKAAQAQDTIPNPDFEYWHNDSLPAQLNNWGDLNSLSYVQYHQSSLFKSTDHVGAGNYSVKIETIQEGPNITVGAIFLSTIANLAGGGKNFKGLGVPYNSPNNPDSIHFSYQCFESAKDSASIILVFKRQGNLIGFYQYNMKGVKNSWTKIDAQILLAPFAPDTVFALISSGASNASYTGDYSMIDNIVLTSNGSAANVVQLPNNSFENWATPTYIAANNWSSSDDVTAPLGGPTSLVQSSDAHSGKYAAQITTEYTTFGHIEGGIILSGPLPTNGGGIKGGFAYNNKPSVLTFYYKYSSYNGLDSALAVVYFYKNGKTLDSFYTRLPQVSAYTKDSIAIPYNTSGSEPDNATIGFASSDIVYGKSDVAQGSVLLIDDIAFSGGNTGIEKDRVLVTANMFPNPAFSNVQIQCYSRADVNTSFTLYDALGREALTKQIHLAQGNNTFNIDVRGLCPGVYIYRLQGGLDELTSKLIIER